MIKTKRLTVAVAMILLSAVLLATASYAWFTMNTQTTTDGLDVEAYTDSLFLEISQTGADDEYDVKTTFTSGNSADLRLVTASLFKTNSFATIVATPGTTYLPANTYYRQLPSEDGAGVNYFKVDAATLSEASPTAGMYKNPVFNLVTTNAVVTGTYYDYEAATDSYKKVEITAASAYGHYALGSVAEDGAAVYEGTGVYYKADASGNLVQVKDLKAASDVTGYYTIVATTVDGTTEAVAATDYYLVSAAGEYSFIGEVPEGQILNEYLFWGRSYSTVYNEVQATNTLRVVDKTTANGTYYLTKTLYLRCGEGTINASHLKVDEVIVGGATNVLSDSIRVLFVATSTADAASPKRISACLYDAGANTYTYSNGSTCFFDTVLGNEKETITVDVYVYFDGTDEIAHNTQMATGTLNSQNIEIKFGIDEHDYNENYGYVYNN